MRVQLKAHFLADATMTGTAAAYLLLPGVDPALSFKFMEFQADLLQENFNQGRVTRSHDEKRT